MYHIAVVVSADFLKSIEIMAHQLGLNKQQLDSEVFIKGCDAVATELMQSTDEELHKRLDLIAPLGAKANESMMEF